MQRCPDCAVRHNGAHMCVVGDEPPIETRETTLGKRVRRSAGKRERIEPEEVGDSLSLDELFKRAADQHEENLPEMPQGPRSVLNKKPHIGLTREELIKALKPEVDAKVPPQIEGSDDDPETVLQHLRRLGVRYTITRNPTTDRPWVSIPLDTLERIEGPQNASKYNNTSRNRREGVE